MRSKHHSHRKKLDYLKSAVIVAVLATALLTTNIISFCAGAAAERGVVYLPASGVVQDATLEMERSGVISMGENGTSVYTVEIWEDGSVVIKTRQGYIDQLSEYTVLVTDRSLDDVQQEILDAMDYPVGEAAE